MIILFKVLFMGEQHEGITLGKLTSSQKWQAFFERVERVK